MLARRRTGPPPADATDALDMFPFLSVMICIVGVLVLLQVIMAAGSASRVRVRLEGLDEAGGAGRSERTFKVPYGFVCKKEGVIEVPPRDLGRLSGAASPEDRELLRTILDRRTNHVAGGGKGRDRAASTPRPVDDEVLAVIEEVQRVNTLARQLGLSYEEYVLFGVYPGGAGCYHEIRKRLYDPQYTGISVGAVPAEEGWIIGGGT